MAANHLTVAACLLLTLAHALKAFPYADPCSSSHLACSPGESCHAEPHSARGFICVPTKPGRAVVGGGKKYINGSFTYLNEVESLNYKAFPDLPQAAGDVAMVKAGDHLYACGGKLMLFDDSHEDNSLGGCYRINVNTPGNEWLKMQSAPIRLWDSAVSLGDTQIWFFRESLLQKFDADGKLSTTVTLPFYDSFYHCSVANGTHAYVIGVGSNADEIWTNKNSMDETEWELAGYLTRFRFGHACLWYGSNIMITGGHVPTRDVEIFNTETREVWAGKEMPRDLSGHRMMLHNGMPTVVGGWTWDYTYIPNITSFSITENRWIESSMKLKTPRGRFALVEV